MNSRVTFNRITLIEWSTIAVMFVMYSLIPPMSEAQTLFKSKIDYLAGNGPLFVAIGDLDGDGNPDLTVANSGSDNVSVLLGNGDGTFQDAVNYKAGLEPVSVAIGDLNGDRNLDLAVANSFDGDRVSVLLAMETEHFRATYLLGVLVPIRAMLPSKTLMEITPWT